MRYIRLEPDEDWGAIIKVEEISHIVKVSCGAKDKKEYGIKFWFKNQEDHTVYYSTKEKRKSILDWLSNEVFFINNN
jgi:hypothetical protein